jgi:CHAD domain-containing protein
MALDSDEVQKPVRKLRKILKKISSNPSPAKVHDLRTRTRQIEATLGALSLDSDRSGRKLLKPLSRVRRSAGQVRDMDVLISYAAGLSGDGDDNCKIELLEHLGSARQRKADKLDSSVSKYGPPLRSRLKRTLSELEDLVGDEQGDETNQRAASSKAAAAVLALESELANTRQLGRRNLHPYRLKVKELRNVLKLAQGEDDQEFVDALGRVKDLIGEWHDWEELLSIASRKLNHGTGCTLMRQLRQKTKEKYERALTETERMRKTYLHVPRAKSKRGSGKLPQPALQAAAKLAA